MESIYAWLRKQEYNVSRVKFFPYSLQQVMSLIPSMTKHCLNQARKEKPWLIYTITSSPGFALVQLFQ